MFRCLTAVFRRSRAQAAVHASTSASGGAASMGGKATKMGDEKGTAPLRPAGEPIGDVVGAPAPPSGYELCARVSALPRPRGLAQYVTTAGTPLAIVHAEGSVHALYDICPHKQANMTLGDVEDVPHLGVCIKCPRHRKKFNGGLNFSVESGASYVKLPCFGEYDSTWTLPVHDVRVQGEFAYVAVHPRTNTRAREDGAAASAAADVAAAGVTRHESVEVLPGGTPASPSIAVHTSQRHHDTDTHTHTHTDKLVQRWTTCRISAKRDITHDSAVYELVPDAAEAPFPPSSALHLASWHVPLRVCTMPDAHDPTTGHVHTPGDACLVEREYTPVSDISSWVGAPSPRMEMLIKHYPTGKLTSALARAVAKDPGHAGIRVFIGDPVVTLETPALLPPSAESLPLVRDKLASAVHMFQTGAPVHIVLIAGGTGVTPVLQLARWLLAPRSVTDTHTHVDTSATRVSICVCQHTRGDGLLESELTQLVAAANDATTASTPASPRPPRASLLLTHTREHTQAGPALSPHPSVPHVYMATGGRITEESHASVWRAFLRFQLASASPAHTHTHTRTHAHTEVPDIARVIVSGPVGMAEGISRALTREGVPPHVFVELEA